MSIQASEWTKEPSNPMQSCSRFHTPTITNPKHLFRGSPDLSQALADLKSCLLPQSHNLEALKVGERPSPLLLCALLGPSTLCPLCLNTRLLPCLLKSAGTYSTGNLLENNGGEDEVGGRNGLAGDGCLLGWAIDEDLLVSQK
jgi:hypothetical protein